MKTFTILALCLALLGCTTRTEFGPCVGIADDKDPALQYKVSAWNAFLGIFFFSLIAPPVFVLVDSTFCPVGVKPKQ